MAEEGTNFLVNTPMLVFGLEIVFKPQSPVFLFLRETFIKKEF